MGIWILIRRGVQRQKGVMLGMALLLLVVCLSVILALTVATNAGSYVDDEMARLAFGDITVWVTSTENLRGLSDEISSVEGVSSVQLQPMVLSGYSMNGHRSDNEGQLIAYEPTNYAYRFLTEDGAAHQAVDKIQPGTIYLSPSMQTTFEAKVGDTVRFHLSRGTEVAEFTVAGWFEDPFMGSSMIDTKSFLISPEDAAKLLGALEQVSDFNRLARPGAMLHIQGDGTQSVRDLNAAINLQTSVSSYTEFVYTRTALRSYMLLLQNLLTGFLAAFAALLLVVAMIVLGHSVSSGVEQEKNNMAILKTMGYPSGALRTLQMAQYGAGVLAGMALALSLGKLLAGYLPRLMVTSTGLLMPAKYPWLLLFAAFAGVLLLLFGFILLRTRGIIRLAPVEVLSRRHGQSARRVSGRIHGRMLSLSLAVRQLLTGKRRYAGIFLISAMLAVFLSIVGRMGAWLGPNGEGLMDAFSAADHDLGVQPMMDMDMAEVENVISFYDAVVDTYELAMQPVSVNGVDYTVNVLDEPEWFHIVEGKTADQMDEILVTAFVAENLGLSIGDEVSVSSGARSESYRVCGIYLCANETGANVGMCKDGYARIANTSGYIWCRHYVFAQGTRNEEIMQELQKRWRVELEVHTNSWSGLDGIVKAMRLMMAFMYAVVAIFIAVVITLSSSRFIRSEQRDMAILKSIGLTSAMLRRAFALRFSLVVLLGALAGLLLSCACADRIISQIVSLFGIGAFHSGFSLQGYILPVLAVTLLFTAFAYLGSGKLKRFSLAQIIQE